MIFKFTISVKSLPISRVAVHLGCDNSIFLTTTAGLPTPSMSNSKKRSSPGADTTKSSDPFTNVDIGSAEESILNEYQKKIQRVELILGEPALCLPTIT
jgi:hypothetical protein